MVQANVDLNSGSEADVYVRLRDRANGYRIRLDSGGNIKLQTVVTGLVSDVASTTYTGTDVALRIKVNGTAIKAWVDGTLEINSTDSTFGAGGVAFGGQKPKIDNLKIGYDDTGSRILARTAVGRHGARLLFAIAITR